jgi:phosphosulfolactate synthase (CoM biosynthesis protein A)
MSEKSAMNVDLRDVQEKVEDGMQSAKNTGRKVVLASVGVWGLAYDKAQELWGAGMSMVDKAERRGEVIEQDFGRRFNRMQEQVQEQPQVKKVVDVVEDGYDAVSKNAKTVVAEVEKFLGQFQPKAEEAMQDVAIEVENLMEAVIPGYDEMAAKDIIAQLPGMPKAKLIEIREYEIKGKNRVTVLREIDVLLETPDTVVI